MGTKQEVLELQSNIKRLAAEIGWSQNKLAKLFYTELNEVDDEHEIRLFQERLKKELQRSTTKVERLRTYLDIMLRQPEADKLDVIFNKYIPQKSISCSLSKSMQAISKEIDKV